MKIYNTIIKPILLNKAETISKKEEKYLRIMKRKVMQTTLGTIKIIEEEYTIIKTNE